MGVEGWVGFVEGVEFGEDEGAGGWVVVLFWLGWVLFFGV